MSRLSQPIGGWPRHLGLAAPSKCSTDSSVRERHLPSAQCLQPRPVIRVGGQIRIPRTRSRHAPAVTRRRASRGGAYCPMLREDRHGSWCNQLRIGRGMLHRKGGFATQAAAGAALAELRDGASAAGKKVRSTTTRSSVATTSRLDRGRIPTFVDLGRKIADIGMRSRPPSVRICPMPWASPPTPRSACPPASRSVSTLPKPSSPWPCSAWAATDRLSPTAPNLDLS